MIVILDPQNTNTDPEVESFFSSLGWVYLSSRYSAHGLALLMRLLTLSGLEPLWWEHCSMRLVSGGSNAVAALLARPDLAVEPQRLKQAIHEIQACAQAVGAFFGDPPMHPVYMKAFGYTAEDYMADLQVVYGASIAESHIGPWQTEAVDPACLMRKPTFLRQAVAIMGATAGAIEQILTAGTNHEHSDG